MTVPLEIEKILVESARSFDLTKQVFKIEQIIKREATSKSKEDNKLLLEEIEKLKFQNKIYLRDIDGFFVERNSFLNVNSELESQLAEAKKEIERIKTTDDHYIAVQQEEIKSFQSSLLDVTNEAISLQSQLQESEEMNKQLVEALEDNLQILNQTKEMRESLQLTAGNVFLISCIEKTASALQSFKDNNKANG